MLTLILLLKILAPYSTKANYCYSALLGLLKKIPVVQKFFSLVSFFFLAFSIEAQTLRHEYDIIKQKEVIGSLTATKKHLSEGFSITIDSRTSISILIDFNVNVYQFNKYHDGKLIDALFIQSLNGRKKVHNTVQWGLNGYSIEKDGRKISLNNDINYSVASMYFEEPVSIQKVFSENQLTVLSLHKVSNHCYEMQLPDGKTNYYSYRDGMLVHARLSTRFTTVELILKEVK